MDINMTAGGPVLGALQIIATITQAILTSLDKQLEAAPDAIKQALLEERLKHEKRLNWALDRIFSLLGYQPEVKP